MLDTVGGDGLKELLRDVVRDALQELIEEELTATIGAARALGGRLTDRRVVR